MASSSTSVERTEERVANEGPPEDEFLKYLPLYRAASRGDWDTANIIFQQDEGAITAVINNFKQTALHVATDMGRNIHFLEELVKLMPKQALLLQDGSGYTALTLAAIAGDIKAADILVNQNPDLVYVRDNSKTLPVTRAARHNKRQMVSYLLNLVSNNIKSYPNPFGQESDLVLLIDVIISKYFDIAEELVEKYPHLAILNLEEYLTPLEVIARIPSAFRRGCNLKYWEAPPIKQIKDKKQMHNHAFQLVMLICKRIETLNNLNDQETHYAAAVATAARVDNPEVIEEIVEIFPNAIWVHDSQDHDHMFHFAVENRSENVFNLAYQVDGNKLRVMNMIDNHGNTILHLAGRLAKPQKLNLISGAALQMQRELQWFKEVERWVRQDYKERTNKGGKTPQMIFTEEHKNLVIDGEKWMRDTANSCAIVASLIVTIVFAAAITVPGGNNQNDGQPVLFKRNAFKIFAISDAISLFSSATSLLINGFSLRSSKKIIYWSCYSVPFHNIHDYCFLLHSLYCVWTRRELVLIGVAILASLPITSFVFQQFPLLVDLISSTYGPGIFGKRMIVPSVEEQHHLSNTTICLQSGCVSSFLDVEFWCVLPKWLSGSFLCGASTLFSYGE
ncbi:unnamed protein product, partial [Thlaspi arvense]